MISISQLELVRILPPNNINGMSLSHSQPLHFSCTLTPLGKIISPTFHRLTSNNSIRSTKPWVKHSFQAYAKDLQRNETFNIPKDYYLIK